MVEEVKTEISTGLALCGRCGGEARQHVVTIHLRPEQNDAFSYVDCANRCGARTRYCSSAPVADVAWNREEYRRDE